MPVSVSVNRHESSFALMGRIVISAAFALLLAAPAAAQEQPANPFAARLLDAHNAARADAGVPPLRWSAQQAAEAQAWADHLAELARMEHSDRWDRNGAGENLWMGTAGRYSAEFMVGAFVAEAQHFRDGVFPNVSRTGQWRDVGHYTQVIWRDTQEVGCAVARGERDDFLVCRYFPAGNTYDQPVR